jgi:hypothetical protein
MLMSVRVELPREHELFREMFGIIRGMPRGLWRFRLIC